MPTPTKGPRLGGGPAHERLMLANLATSLFEHDRITTTEAKAKRLRPLAERLITFAKRGDLHARRQVMTVIRDKDVVHKLFAEIGPKFETRPGGYTRIVKTGPRKGDNAPMAIIELVEELHRRSCRGRAGTRHPNGAEKAPAGRTREIAEDAAAESATAAAVAAETADEDRRRRFGGGSRRARHVRGRGGRGGRRAEDAGRRRGAARSWPRSQRRGSRPSRPTTVAPTRRSGGPAAAGPPGHLLRRHRVLRLGGAARPAHGAGRAAGGARDRPAPAGGRADRRRTHRRRRARHRPGRALSTCPRLPDRSWLRRLAGVLPVMCGSARCGRRPAGIRRPVRRAVAPLRIPHRDARRLAVAATVRAGPSPRARRRGDVRRGDAADRAARLRRVLPAPRGCDHAPDAARVQRRTAAGEIVCTIQADAFCHSMVRSLVGALLAVGEGRRPARGRPSLLTRSSRADEVSVAPAHGLTLVEVGYPADAELAVRAAQTRARR